MKGLTVEKAQQIMADLNHRVECAMKGQRVPRGKEMEALMSSDRRPAKRVTESAAVSEFERAYNSEDPDNQASPLAQAPFVKKYSSESSKKGRRVASAVETFRRALGESDRAALPQSWQ